MSEFWQAIQQGDEEQVRRFLAEDPDRIRARAENGHGVVRMATDCGHTGLAEMLLGEGAPMDVHDAAALGREAQVREAVQQDPDLLSKTSHDGMPLLHLACFFGHQALAEWLIHQGAPVDAHSDNPLNNTALHAALAGVRSSDLIRVLIEAGADVAAIGGSGVTPLHLAAARGDGAMVDLLLEQGARSTAMEDGRSPADMARDYGHPELAERIADPVA